MGRELEIKDPVSGSKTAFVRRLQVGEIQDHDTWVPVDMKLLFSCLLDISQVSAVKE